MSETRVEIADEPAETGASPYQNLWVPLIVVPAGIVITIVVVMAIFGSLTGDEKTPAENLELVIHGGTNQAEQALFNLIRQSVENQRALLDGSELPWPLPDGFADKLAAAIAEVDEDKYSTKLALASFLAGSDPRGVEALEGLLSIPEAADSAGDVRFRTIVNLGNLAAAGLVPEGTATEKVLGFLESDDEALRNAAAAALAFMPGEAIRPALVATLADSSLAVRATAALSLVKLDPPGTEAATVLRDLANQATYDAAREANPRHFSRGEEVSRYRSTALEALAHLGRDEDWAFIEGFRDDSDMNVVDSVLRLLDGRGDG